MRNKNACVSDPNAFYTCSGDEFHVIYNAKLLDDGTIKLIESDKEDIQAKIDSFRDVTDMAYILRQLQLGDTSVLTNKTAMYGDFTIMPKNMLEAMQVMIDGEKAFYDLDLETRQKFDNNFRQWLIGAGSEEWFKKMGVTGTSDVESIKENVSESEDKV